jgi:DNA-directed RNA polymerase specialized sigma24 family protein
VQQHADGLLRFLAVRVGWDEAEDCLQETFLAALRGYPSLRTAENLPGWLLTIARNKATDALRQAARRPVAVAEVPEGAPADPPVGSAPDVWDAVGGLPAKQRQAVVMRFGDDHSYAHIARRMATSEDAARRNVHEGIKRLRRNTL